MNQETEKIEFKSQFTEEIYKEVIAFANTEGGVLYVGIDNDGNVTGITDVDKEYQRITNGIRDAIAPDVTMFVQFSIQANKVVRITVQEGTNKPYYLKAKGLKPSGVYVRQGTSSAPASIEAIRQMIKNSDGDCYEDMRSINQELNFSVASDVFQQCGIAFGTEKYRALGITKKEELLFTNLALLLSDQCTHTIKIAVFADEANTVFKDSKEFSGSVFQQIDDAFDYLNLCNRKKAVFEGLTRIETPDYPPPALREALLNAVIHRDYSYSGSIIINVNDTEIQFISIGGLLNGLSVDDICSGISQPRNRKLAEVFHRLRFIESYGTGIRKIYHSYAGCNAQPQIEVTANTFKIILPNQNECAFFKKVSEPNHPFLSLQMKMILDYVNEHGQITEEDIQKLANVKRTRAYLIAKELCDMGRLTVVGRGKEKQYLPKE